MEKEESGYRMVLNLYKKYIQPFIAIFILVLLVMTVNGLIEYKSLQEEIRENCGWEEEAYKCYCNKNQVKALQDLRDNKITDISFINSES